MFENEFWLLLNSPAIPFRIHNRNGKVRRVGWGPSSALPARSPPHRPLSYRATSSCCRPTMRGLSGGRPFRNCRKKVSLGLTRPSWGSCPLPGATRRSHRIAACCSLVPMASAGCVLLKVLSCPLPDLQAFVLSSVELQVLTGSCFKLRTVHNIPVTSNKDGECVRWAGTSLRMMPGSSCEVPRLEQSPYSGTLAVQGESYPPGGTAGAESGSQAEQSRLQHGAAFWGLSSTPMGWAGQGCPQGETRPVLLGTSPRAVRQQESSGCPSGMIGSRGYVSSSRP